MAVVSNGTTIISGGALASGFGGTLVLLSTQTASNSATISFTTGLDSTYDAYEFHFINIKPVTDGVDFQFQGSTNGGSSYGVTITSTYFDAVHNEGDTNTYLSYETILDLAQSTSYQSILNNTGNGADECGVGTLQIYNPSSTTYVKHFISRCQNYYNTDYSIDSNIAGYFNTTSAVNAIQFKMASGNISDGTIKLYGVKKS